MSIVNIKDYVTLKEAQMIGVSLGFDRSFPWWRSQSQARLIPRERILGRVVIKRDELVKFIEQKLKENK